MLSGREGNTDLCCLPQECESGQISNFGNERRSDLKT
jgi:hypothetical protein